jgi:hypothetical protein
VWASTPLALTRLGNDERWGGVTRWARVCNWEETRRGEDFLSAYAFPSLQPPQNVIEAPDGADSFHLSWAYLWVTWRAGLEATIASVSMGCGAGTGESLRLRAHPLLNPSQEAARIQAQWQHKDQVGSVYSASQPDPGYWSTSFP